MKLKKVYRKGTESIVCHRGSHFASHSSAIKADRVSVVPGEEPDTVVVNGTEVWGLKGSYTKKAPGVRRTHAQKEVQEVPEPDESVLARIREVAPNPGAETLMRTMYTNWLHGCTHLTLYKGLNFDSKDVTQAVHALGEEIMKGSK
jgi:hypothetical protein